MKAALFTVAVLALSACASKQVVKTREPRLAVDVPRRAPVKGGPFDFNAARPRPGDPRYHWDMSTSVKMAGSVGLPPGAR